MNKKRNLIWRGFFSGSSGITSASKIYPLAANIAGIKCFVDPIRVMDKDDMLQNIKATPKEIDEGLVILHQIPTRMPDNDGYFVVTEFETCHPSWWPLLTDAEIILTQSQFCKEVFSRIPGMDPDKIHIVQYPITPNFVPEGKKVKYNWKGPVEFVFGSVFEWVGRKKPELMWQAFMEEFPIDEYPDVRFVNRISEPWGFKDWRVYFNKFTKKDPRIVVLDKFIPEISDLYRSFDCYCSPTAGEGWGATLSEAMACGIPSIGSRHSGNLDFMNDENSYLVEVEEWSYVEKDITNRVKGLVLPWMRWKLPKVESIRKAMRAVYTIKINGNINPISAEAVKVAKKLNIIEIGEQIRKIMEPIL